MRNLRGAYKQPETKQFYKKRIYVHVENTINIHRVMVWNAVLARYEIPKRGLQYLARRRETNIDGTTVLRAGSFNSLIEARAWQNERAIYSQERPQQQGAVRDSQSSPSAESTVVTKKIGTLIDQYVAQKFPTLKASSQSRYRGLIERHFSSLRVLGVQQVDARAVDEWLSQIRASGKGTRQFCRNELALLSAILQFYVEHFDEAISPWLIKEAASFIRESKVVRERDAEITFSL